MRPVRRKIGRSGVWVKFRDRFSVVGGRIESLNQFRLTSLSLVTKHLGQAEKLLNRTFTGGGGGGCRGVNYCLKPPGALAMQTPVGD